MLPSPKLYETAIEDSCYGFGPSIIVIWNILKKAINELKFALYLFSTYLLVKILHHICFNCYLLIRFHSLFHLFSYDFLIASKLTTSVIYLIFRLQLKKMSNTKPTQQPSEPSEEVEKEPELIDGNGVEGDIQQEQEQEKKDNSKVNKKVNNGSVKKPQKEGKKSVLERGEKKKPLSSEEISKTRHNSKAVRGEKRKRPSREEISKTRYGALSFFFLKNYKVI